ncbi:MAG: DUF305 domain-containing protein [Gemmatimonadota bacterium]
MKNLALSPLAKFRRISGLVLAVALSACASSGASDSAAPPGAGTSAPGPDTTEDGPSPAELEALYRARSDSALLEFTDDDVRFMTGMIGHHAQALAMAGLAPTHEASPTIRTLAARIINAQRDEIETMQRWLRDRSQPVPEVNASGELTAMDSAAENRSHDGDPGDHRETGAEESMRIPGMLTQQQMRELDRAEGRDFDRLFLRYMIQHHRGAVVAVRELFATDGAARGDVTFRLASGIQVDQITEIERMESMLESMESR